MLKNAKSKKAIKTVKFKETQKVREQQQTTKKG